MAGDRAPLLRDPRHIDGPEAKPRVVRSLRQHRRYRDHAGSADAGDDHRVGLICKRRQLRLGQCAEHVSDAAQRIDSFVPFCLPRLGAVQHHEARAEPFDAAEILVAGGLINVAFAAEFGLARQHRHTIRFHAAITAALTHGGIDHHAPVGIGKRAALATPTLLGSTGLIVDQHRHSRYLSQLLLNDREIETMANMHAGRQRCIEAILFGLVRDDHNALHAFSENLCRHFLDREPAIQLLPAGHRDCVVEEQLERHRRAGSYRRADGKAARVNVGSVAEVLKHMVALGEWCLADPVGALPAHLREAFGIPVHPLHHVVAADASVGA